MTLRQLSFSAAAFLLLFTFACTETAPTGNSSTDTETAERSVTEEPTTTPQLAAPDCVVEGEVLEGNQVWIQSSDVLAVIKADASTTQEGFGPSHRLFQILDGRSCDTKFETTLPENVSPDYPYYIAEVQYNTLSSIIGIQGFYKVLICDMSDGYKMSELEPSFASEREYADSQSGMVQRLEVWEDYLLGYAQDAGAFAFDLSSNATPEAVLPFAEWQDPDNGRYHSLFLLPTEDGVQGILPFYDAEEDAFMLYPLFDQPVQVSQNVPQNARNNQFLVLRQTDAARTPLAINLGTRDLMELPADIASQNTQAILKWMQEQEN